MIDILRDRNKDIPTFKALLSPGLNALFGAANKRAPITPQEVVMNPGTTRSKASLKNEAAHTFRSLLFTWQHDAASGRIDTLAAELTAQVAKDGSVCVGLMQVSSIPKLFGLIYFLDGYGLLLRQCYREQRDGVFVYVDRKGDVASEFVGSVVNERIPEVAPVWPELARAA
ncbi:MAG: hypothetical protein ACRCYY_12380 [Trueperaceae bacterium]